MRNGTYLKVKKENLIMIIYAISAVYFANNGGLSTALLSNDIIHLLMLAIFFCVPILGLMLGKIKLLKKDIPIYLLYILMFAVTLHNSDWSLYSTIRYTSILLFCIYVTKSLQLAKYSICMLLFTYYIYAFFTFFEFFDRGFYLNHILPLFEDTAGVLRNAFKLGYMAGITGHTSSNGMFLSCAILIIASRYLAYRNKKDIIILFVFITALLLTGKRGHIIFIILSLYGIYYFSLTGQRATRKIPKIIGIVFLSMCLALIVMQSIPSVSIVASRMQNFFAGEDTSVQIRFKLWNLAINGFKEHPFIGIGWHQFYSKLSYQVGSNRGFETHNVYLQLLCETGIIGFSIYISWFLFILATALNMYKKIVVQPNAKMADKQIIGFAFAFQLFFALYCITGNPLYDWKMNVPYFMTCGIILNYRNALRRQSESFAVVK